MHVGIFGLDCSCLATKINIKKFDRLLCGWRSYRGVGDRCSPSRARPFLSPTAVAAAPARPCNLHLPLCESPVHASCLAYKCRVAAPELQFCHIRTSQSVGVVRLRPVTPRLKPRAPHRCLQNPPNSCNPTPPWMHQCPRHVVGLRNHFAPRLDSSPSVTQYFQRPHCPRIQSSSVLHEYCTVIRIICHLMKLCSGLKLLSRSVYQKKSRPHAGKQEYQV